MLKNKKKDPFKQLIEAIKSYQMAHVTILLQQPISIHSYDDEGWTPLMQAIYSEYIDMVQLLLAHGADINQSSRDGLSPILLATQACQGEMAAFVASVPDLKMEVYNEGSRTPLMIAIERNMPQVVKALLTHGADPNFTPFSNIHPLILAVGHFARGDSQIVQELLKAGADTNIQNQREQTPLMLAAGHGYKQAVQALLKAGADPVCRDDRGRAACVYAAQYVHFDIVCLLPVEKNWTESHRQNTILDQWRCKQFAILKQDPPPYFQINHVSHTQEETIRHWYQMESHHQSKEGPFLLVHKVSDNGLASSAILAEKADDTKLSVGEQFQVVQVPSRTSYGNCPEPPERPEELCLARVCIVNEPKDPKVRTLVLKLVNILTIEDGQVEHYQVISQQNAQLKTKN